MYELSGVDKFIRDTIVNDSMLQVIFGGTVNFYDTLAPEQAPYPRIISELVDSRDVRGMSTYRSHNRPMYQLKVVGKDLGFHALWIIANRIDTILQGNSSDNTDGVYVGRFYRVGIHKYIENYEGIIYYNIAQDYFTMAYAI